MCVCVCVIIDLFVYLGDVIELQEPPRKNEANWSGQSANFHFNSIMCSDHLHDRALRECRGPRARAARPLCTRERSQPSGSLDQERILTCQKQTGTRG